MKDLAMMRQASWREQAVASLDMFSRTLDLPWDEVSTAGIARSKPGSSLKRTTTRITSKPRMQATAVVADLSYPGHALSSSSWSCRRAIWVQ